ncbi:MAG: hypothetical protein K2N43_07080, partial [Lachnospiraceae bacterium]|nr:hypothetical protein [Lachnospiraceae bacterium]
MEKMEANTSDMHFGFSYVGLIYLVMLTLPNILWTKNQPKDYEKYVVNENKVLLALERIGEVIVSCAALVFSDFNIKSWSVWSWWLVISFALMILYEIYWIRYFRLDSRYWRRCYYEKKEDYEDLSA